MKCPSCNDKLLRTPEPTWECISCGGELIQLDWLKQKSQKTAILKIISLSRQLNKITNRHCSICTQAMFGFVIQHNGQNIELETCGSCRVVWFDQREFDSVMVPTGQFDLKELQKVPVTPTSDSKPSTPKLPSDIAELPVLDGKQIEEIPGVKEYLTALLLQVPIKTHTPILKNAKFYLFILGLMIGISIIYWITDSDFLTFNPANPLRHLGVGIVTSFFTHAGFFHLFFNGAFLLVFSPEVEEYLGYKYFLYVLFLSDLLSSLIYVLMGHSVEFMGASTGISAIISFYAVVFPRARVFMTFFFVLFRVPVWLYFVIWITPQLLPAFLELTVGARISGVAYVAHVTGCIFGIVAALRWRRNSKFEWGKMEPAWGTSKNPQNKS